MKNVSFLFLIILFCSVGLFSCGKKGGDPVPLCSVAWATDLQNEISTIANAVAAYSADQSAENCTALKAAYQGYINKLKPYGNCATLAGQKRSVWQKAVNEAEADIATVC